MLENHVAPLKYQVYKGIGGKFGAVQFTASSPHFFCTKDRKHKFYRGEIVQQANFSRETRCPIEGCGGSLSSREGCIFVEMAPTIAKNKYNWEQKIMFALSIKDIGQVLYTMEQPQSIIKLEQLLIAMKKGVDLTALENLSTEAKKTLSLKLVHDPGAGTEQKGQIVKELSYYVKDATRGALLSLTESKKGEEKKKSFTVPMTADEVLVLKLLMESFVASMLAWQ